MIPVWSNIKLGTKDKFLYLLGPHCLKSGVDAIKFTGALQGIREGEKAFKEQTHGSLRRDTQTCFKARRRPALLLVTAPVL